MGGNSSLWRGKIWAYRVAGSWRANHVQEYKNQGIVTLNFTLPQCGISFFVNFNCVGLTMIIIQKNYLCLKIKK
jgi:hypothetical protein